MPRSPTSPGRPAAEERGDRSTPGVLIDHALPLSVRVLFHSEHVVAYRLWTRSSDREDWSLAFDGDSENGLSDTLSIDAMASGAAMAFWIGIAGPANTPYDVGLEFRQKGAQVAGGAIARKGKTNAEGAAEAKGQVVFP